MKILGKFIILHRTPPTLNASYQKLETIVPIPKLLSFTCALESLHPFKMHIPIK